MRLLTVSPGTIQHMRITGMLPFTKIDGVIYYDALDIEKMITSNKQNSKSKPSLMEYLKSRTLDSSSSHNSRMLWSYLGKSFAPCSFLHGARCTNVYTFDLVRSASGRYGDVASELGLIAHAKIMFV